MSKNIVAVVLDPEYGNHLAVLADEKPVWIVDAPANRAAAEALWASKSTKSAELSLTTFPVESGSSAETRLAGVVPTVDLHHGEHSQHPPYAGIEVFGARPTAEVREVLREFGMEIITERPDGFLAMRSSVV